MKQGGILSPILFYIYIDGLLQNLANSGQGCHIGLDFLAVFAYADDIILLAPSASVMRSLLSVCNAFAKEFDVVLNADKSKVYFLIVCQVIRRFIYQLFYQE